MKNFFVSAFLLSLLWMSSCSSTPSANNSATTGNSTASAAEQPSVVPEAEGNTPANPSAAATGEVVKMTKAIFIDKVYDFEKNPSAWTYKSDKPCIIDFYADWCRPCKMVAPIMDELALKYAGQVNFYKVNTDQERELAQFFGIRSIPSILFCPATGQPQMAQGALPKETYEKAISELLIEKK